MRLGALYRERSVVSTLCERHGAHQTGIEWVKAFGVSAGIVENCAAIKAWRRSNIILNLNVRALTAEVAERPYLASELIRRRRANIIISLVAS